MPLYEYQCDNCGDVFELIQHFSDAPLSVHEKCGGPVHRLISAPALRFKGSGWYINDYGRSSSSGSDKNGSGKSEGESKTSSESKGSSESKPESSKPAPTTSSSSEKTS